MKKYRNLSIFIISAIMFCISICFIPLDASKFIPIIESNAKKEFGINVHIEKLIFQFGPVLKVKTPTMHLMYEDGQKFGQFNNVRFLVPWSAILKKDTNIKRIYANDFIVKVNSNDKYLNNIIDKLQNKEFNERPNINLKKYSISYKDTSADKIYKLYGKNLDIIKLPNFKNFKINTVGEFFINDKMYLSYDLSVTPNIDMPDFSNFSELNIRNILEQIETLDFYSDIMADLKVYQGQNDTPQFSGLVNIDNISVLDPAKRSPKSFIYLTLWGNRIGVLSNIYAENDKKIYIDGNIINSKKPEIDLKVKTDEIKLSALFQKIKLLTHLTKFKEIDALDGTMLADFNLKGDINKIKSSGYLSIKNASVKAGCININKIESDIDFSNNIINITHAIGYVQNAPIMIKGKIDKNIDLEVLMSKVELKHLLPAKFGIKSGIASLAGHINGTLDNIIHKENLQIENFASEFNNNKISFNSLKIDTNKEDTAYISNIIIKPQKTEFIKIPMLKLLIAKDTIQIPITNIFMPNSKCTAKAEILNYATKDFTFNLNLKGNLNSKDISNIKDISINYPIQLTLNGNKNVQNIESQVLLENAMFLDEPAIINFVSKIEDNNFKIDDLSIVNYNGSFTNNFKANIKGQKKASVSGIIENIDDPSFKNVRIFIPQQLNITFLDTVAQIKGDLFINGKIKKPEIVGQISVQNLFNKVLQLQMNNFTIDFNKNIAVINAANIKMADSAAGINATVSTDITKELLIKNLNFKSKYVNLDTILMYKDNPILKLLPININDGKFYAEKAVISIYGSPINFSALSADFKLKDNVFMARNIYSEMFNGKLAASLDFNLKDENFTTGMQARGVSAGPIFDIVAINKDRVSGTMDYDAKLKGNLSSKQSLNGNIKFSVHNGRMETLGKLEHLLYAQNVIADNMLRTSLSVVTKAITLKDTGLFKYLRGDITMQNGIAKINMLQSQGPLMSLFIKGTYNPINDYAKLTILGRLSDEVVSGLGAFGDFSFNKLLIMLTGEENKYNITPNDLDKLPQLPMRNTKEFMSIINGVLEKPSSVILFNWISYSQKSYRQKETPSDNTKVPEFIEALPY